MKRNSFRLLSAVFTFLLVSSSLQGQVFSYSVAFGGNTSNLNFTEESTELEAKQAYHFNAAIYANYKITRSLFFRTGLRYTRIGSDIFVNRDSYTIDPDSPLATRYDIIKDYLYFPLKIAYQSEATWNFAFTGGIELGYLIGGEVVTNYDYGDPATEDISDTIEKFNAALNGTIGYDFPFLGLGLMTEVGLSYGLLDVAKKEAWAFTWKTMEFYLLIGFYI